ncbi:hypothetical protein [Methylophilus sp. Leaf408]
MRAIRLWFRHCDCSWRGCYRCLFFCRGRRSQTAVCNYRVIHRTLLS